MILIIGLGNPGQRFQKTRHNIGFRVVDEFVGKNNFPDFKSAKKFNAEISEGSLDGNKVILAKPQTFMNSSGKSIKLLLHSILGKSLFVVHDDIDIPLGKIKIVKNRGAAGHKGVESIINELRTKNFARFRIGIKPINNEQRTMNNAEILVLQKFSKEEEKIIKDAIKKTVEAIELAIKEGVERAMNCHNR